MTFVPRGLTVACAALALASLTACATSSPPGYSTYPSHQQPGYQQPGYGAEFGRVSSIQIVQVPQGGQTSGAGAVVGALPSRRTPGRSCSGMRDWQVGTKLSQWLPSSGLSA